MTSHRPTSKVAVLYEDEDCAVLNKPAGLVVHADGHTKEKTLTDWVRAHYPECEGVGEQVALATGEVIEKDGIVHRLDRDTSGVLVIARNQEAFKFLKKQFQARTTKKVYQAFVYGEMKREDGIIDRPIGRSTRDFREWTASNETRGTVREAVTAYRVIKKCGRTAGGLSYLEVLPKTGRTHQIRVHLKSIGHPIVGDKLYAMRRAPALGFTRTALHALALEFSTPHHGHIRIEAPLPADFEHAVAELGKLC